MPDLSWLSQEAKQLHAMFEHLFYALRWFFCSWVWSSNISSCLWAACRSLRLSPGAA